MNKTTKLMVFMAMYAALAIVLDYVKELIPFTSIWANGGSIDIALIPLVFASVHLGWKWGLATGLLEFLLSYVVGATKLYFAAYSPALGFLCDYIIPCVVMGLVSLFMINKNKITSVVSMEIGIVICMAVRIFSQVLSGVYCWVDAASDAGSAAAWSFSLSYNLSYGLPTLVMLLIVMPALYMTFRKQINRSL